MEKFWLISVNMGYGHQRTAFPLRKFSKEWIQANDYEGIPKRDRDIWEWSRRGYEFISRFKKVPLIGEFAFSIFDFFQRIYYFYPKRDLSQPNFATERIYSLFKSGWGRHLIEKLKAESSKLKTNLPIVSTFFTPAFMAEYFEYPGEIFLIVCDADVSRSWAPLKPKESKIKYFVPNERVFERLQLYGIKKENIFLTGYPLPIENIGSENTEILKEDLKFRLLNLDPEFSYFAKYRELVLSKLGPLPEKSDHPLTILFSVGGAGAQREIGAKILWRLKDWIKEKKIKVILSAGIKKWVRDYFVNCIKYLKIEKFLGESIEIIFEEKIEDYFKKFNKTLRKTDILWTKPSELSFYSALGIPILISPPIGSQEEFNMRYLLKSGFGIFQENPNYLEQWLFDWLKKGYLAEAAMQGFVEGEKFGTFKILEIIKKFSK
jgi:hypothetical protein